jgi:hypothetical protein
MSTKGRRGEAPTAETAAEAAETQDHVAGNTPVVDMFELASGIANTVTAGLPEGHLQDMVDYVFDEAITAFAGSDGAEPQFRSQFGAGDVTVMVERCQHNGHRKFDVAIKTAKKQFEIHVIESDIKSEGDEVSYDLASILADVMAGGRG